VVILCGDCTALGARPSSGTRAARLAHGARSCTWWYPWRLAQRQGEIGTSPLFFTSATACALPALLPPASLPLGHSSLIKRAKRAMYNSEDKKKKKKKKKKKDGRKGGERLRMTTSISKLSQASPRSAGQEGRGSCLLGTPSPAPHRREPQHGLWCYLQTSLSGLCQTNRVAG